MRRFKFVFSYVLACKSAAVIVLGRPGAGNPGKVGSWPGVLAANGFSCGCVLAANGFSCGWVCVFAAKGFGSCGIAANGFGWPLFGRALDKPSA